MGKLLGLRQSTPVLLFHGRFRSLSRLLSRAENVGPRAGRAAFFLPVCVARCAASFAAGCALGPNQTTDFSRTSAFFFPGISSQLNTIVASGFVFYVRQQAFSPPFVSSPYGSFIHMFSFFSFSFFFLDFFKPPPKKKKKKKKKK